MAKSSGGLRALATGKNVRTVEGRRIDVTAVSNRAARVRATAEDTRAAEARIPISNPDYLRFMGLQDTRPQQVRALAKERAVLRFLQSEVGGNIIGQWGNGRWNVTSGRTIAESLDAYLWRRVHGQRQRWSKR